MKRVIYYLMMLSFLFVSCAKGGELSASKEATFTATCEQQSPANEVKSYLDGTHVKWSAGDAISVFDETGVNKKFTLKSGAESTQGTFSGSKSESQFTYVIYPYSVNNSISESTITFTLPSTQYYAEDSFGECANVSVARIDEGNMAFKNVLGSLKLLLCGNVTVSGIELQGKNEENLAGVFSVDASEATPEATYVSDGTKTLTLDCGEAGIALAGTTPKAFIFTTPVGSFTRGFSVTIHAKSGESYTISTSADNTVVRSTLVAMPAKKIGPAIYTEVEYIGTTTEDEYIDTGLKYTLDDVVECEFSVNGTFRSIFGAGTHQTSDDRIQAFIRTQDGLTLRIGAKNGGKFIDKSLDEYHIARIDLVNMKCYLDGELVLEDCSVEVPTPTNYLFNRHFAQGNSDGHTNMKGHVRIKSFKHWRNGELIRDFVPCICGENTFDVAGDVINEGTICMYEKVNNVFYQNMGGGSFEAPTDSQ